MTFWRPAAQGTGPLPMFWAGIRAINVLLSSINNIFNMNNDIAPRRLIVDISVYAAGTKSFGRAI